MKVYRVDVQDASSGTMVSWFPTKAAAQAFLRKLEHEDASFRSVNVATDKAGLVAWLNSNLGTDNG